MHYDLYHVSNVGGSTKQQSKKEDVEIKNLILKKYMNHKTLFLFVALLTATIYSCKKDIEPMTTATSYPNFPKLKVGNFWVQDQFDIRSTGIASSRNIFDTCYVEKDTIINSKTYFKIVRLLYYSPQKEIMFLKDTLHYIINSNGEILFSSQDFSNVLLSRYAWGEQMTPLINL